MATILKRIKVTSPQSIFIVNFIIDSNKKTLRRKREETKMMRKTITFDIVKGQSLIQNQKHLSVRLTDWKTISMISKLEM
jgi:hypothetical protein